MKTISKKEKTTYVSPRVKVVKIKVEKGFALSDGTTLIDTPPQNFFTIKKVGDGRAAW